MARRQVGVGKLIVSILAIGAVAAGVSTLGGTEVRLGGLASASGDAPSVPKLTWSSCQVVFECATAKVPLDYDEPEGKQVTLALIRKAASDQRHRVGSLFVNPGGPGMAITDPVTFGAIASGLGPRVQARFDIVGIDPRGVGGSSPISCTAAPGTTPVKRPEGVYPSPAQYDQWFAADAYVRKSCAATAGDILQHASTADTARDMDLIRQAVGDRQLSFYGLSYGSIVGQTYAALFPKQVRAVAVDAVLDPIPTFNGTLPARLRVKSHLEAADAVKTALEHCDRAGPARCPLAGNANARFERVRRSLAEHPLQLPGLTLDDKTFMQLTGSAFGVDHITGLPLPTISLWASAVHLIDQVQQLNGSNSSQIQQVGGLIARLKKSSASVDEKESDLAAGDVTGGMAQALGIWCVDTANPQDRDTWIKSAEAAEKAAPGYGAADTWPDSACAHWPGSSADAYRGPFNVTTATPLLMVNATHDGRTSLAGMRSAAARFPGTGVVEVRSWGHTVLGKSNRCLRPATDAYLIDQRLPAHGLQCSADDPLFGTSS
ncbi:alpha/beta fold hydrolase [Actinomadura barringtoniae]|uniref:Alpha/beta fold hydrolase n=1 Tax=Actinomadura barringtoniae TaxID=1427535 RepID=A0A939PIV2_9ACTN|nr:alpha/beta hydrolase [Actinomadura barringtoniae]MBO2453092.1 alpha/beta fold hydrolase [Actinomadura barringtoniae]